MQTEAGKAVTEVLDVLAAKFGTTVAHLWEILVRQAMIDGGIAIVFIALGTTAAIYCWRVALTTIPLIGPSKYDDEGALIFKSIVSCIGALAGLITAIWHINTALTSLLNPEFAAVRYILGKVTGT